MIHLQWPWLLLALPLPWLLWRWLAPLDNAAVALRVPFLHEFDDAPVGRPLPAGQGHPPLLAIAAWLLLVLAAARPQWLGEPMEQAVSGRDLLLAVDLSGSMAETDFVLNGDTVNRLTAIKHVAGQFIERRAGDRIGLILFGSQPYLQAPLTFDRKTVHTLLDEAVIGMAGDATAIGDALGLAVKRLRTNPAEQRVLILLTDGANTAGTIAPLKATDLAAAAGLKIYTIGVGADEMVVRDFFGTRRVNPSADLDETTLKAIAEKTGGRYFRARDTDELEQIYALLDRLEPTEKDVQYFRPHQELYPWPLGLALLLAAGMLGRQLYARRVVN
ncbi:MAG: VWA domain-containing protein [Methylococcaceae bacterium]|nr:MAG: VWA domain-containing protein [Methylococcaceae bacterium]